MNILPLILALVLMLSVLTVEKMEKFKNQSIVQKEYQSFLKMSERQVFNKRQKSLYGINDKHLRQLSFRFLFDKKARDRDPSVAKQYRMLILDLMRNVYGEAPFFKKLELNRSNFLEELLDAIENSTKDEENTIKRIQDIARINLKDPELQDAFYHMLKGTVTREELKEIKKNPGTRSKEKAYESLFTYINNNGANATPRIVIQRAPPEILKTIFEKDEIVEAIIAKRNELAANKESGSEALFQSEFKEKRRQGLDDKLLDFSISKGDKSSYN